MATLVTNGVIHERPWEGSESLGRAGAEECHKSEGSPSHLIHTALSCRMDSFEDKLQQLREAFNAGRTRSAEFRAAQLQGLSHFLRDNKQQLQEALAQDLHKVAWDRDSGVGLCVPPGWQGWYSWDKEHILQEEELKAQGTAAPFVRHSRLCDPSSCPPSTLQLLTENSVCAWYQSRVWRDRAKQSPCVYKADFPGARLCMLPGNV